MPILLQEGFEKVDDLVPDFTAPKAPEEPTFADMKWIAKMASAFLEDLHSQGLPAPGKSPLLDKFKAWLVHIEKNAGKPEFETNLALDVLTKNGFDRKAELWREELEKVLTISTAHITEATSELLDANEARDTVSYTKDEYGWLVYVPEAMAPTPGNNEGEDPSENRPMDLHACMLFACKLGCTWLMLDRDAEQIDELTTYEW